MATKKTDEVTLELPRYQRHDKDTGSAEYQVFQLSQKIASLQWHLQANHKDYDAKRTLLRQVAERRSHLRFLKANDMDKYVIVSKKTGLKV